MEDSRLTLELVVDRSTKNTIRFEEDCPEGGTPILNTLYVQKWATVELGSPRRIRVTIEAVADAA